MKTVLLTGATGFIGSHLLKDLLKIPKYRIRIFIREQSDLSRIEKSLSRVDVFKGDFSKDEDIEASLKDVDILIHLASILQRARKKDYQEFNVKASERFFYFANSLKVKKIIFLSSIEVMGGRS